MRFLHGSSKRVYRGLGRVACVVLLAMTLVLISGCGGSSSSAPLRNLTCAPTDLAEPRGVCFWLPGIFLVGLVSNTGALPQTTNAIPNNVNTEIKVLLPSGLTASPLSDWPADIPHSMASTTPPALMVFDQPATTAPEVAIASYELVDSTGKTDMSNADLTKAVDAINAAINSKVCVDVSSVSGSISCTPSSTSTVWLVGATPDLAALGGDLGHIGGSPGGPPGTGQVQPAAWTDPLSVPNSTNGTGKAIYVLDTALNAPGTLCLNPPAHGNLAPQVGDTPCDFLNLPEDTFSLPNQLIPEGYPFPGTDCNLAPTSTKCSFLRHGEFVAKIIQHIAPKANLHLIGVLDNYGATDVRSLLYGLYQVVTMTSQQGSGVIVNLSLDIEPPTECLPIIWSDTEARVPDIGEAESVVMQETTPTTMSSKDVKPVTGTYPVVTYKTSNDTTITCSSLVLTSMPTKIARLYVPIGLVMEQLNEAKYTLVAAAGNDSMRYDADMPAAFCGVYAVAATDVSSGSPATSLTSAGQAGASQAPFSNNPYLNNNNSCMQVPVSFSSGSPAAIATPDVIRTPINPGSSPKYAYAPGSGVCSFYDDSAYANDMGTWFGTSFATPLVSGELAALGTVVNSSSNSPDWEPCK
jgi:hypothetical protein